MRIGGEAPRRRTHSRNRFSKPWLASGDRHLGSSSDTGRCSVSSASESLSFLSPRLTPLAIRRQPEPRQWLPDATRQWDPPIECSYSLKAFFQKIVVSAVPPVAVIRGALLPVRHKNFTSSRCG